MADVLDELETSKNNYQQLLKQFESLADEYKNTLTNLDHFRIKASKLESRLESANRKVHNSRQLQNEFLDTISHELLTPLNGILGMSRLLSDIPLPQEAKDSIDIIKSCGESLESILKNLFDFIHLSKGEIEFICTSFDPIESISELVSEYGQSVYSKNLEITYIPDHKEFGLIEIDKDRFEQIIHILLSNAAKFTNSGHITIESTIVPRSQEAPVRRPMYELQLNVRDTGIGISSKDLKHIFRPFEQIDSSNNRNYGGIGIGLTLGKEIITQMGGGILIDSEPGIGSTFFVSLPLAGVSNSVPPPPPKHVGTDIIITTVHAPHKKLLTQLFNTLDLPIVFENTLPKRDTENKPVWIIDYPANKEKAAEMNKQLEQSEKTKAHTIALVPDNAKVPGRIKNLFQVIVPKPITLQSLRDALEYTHALDQGEILERKKIESRKASKPDVLSDRVLLVDDNPINQKIVLHMIDMLGIPVDSISSLDELKAKIESDFQYTHLVINPSVDPTSNLSLIYLILNATQIVNKVQVVAITGKNPDISKDQFREAGFHGHVQLPARLEDFAEALQVTPK